MQLYCTRTWRQYENKSHKHEVASTCFITFQEQVKSGELMPPVIQKSIHVENCPLMIKSVIYVAPMKYERASVSL